MKTTVVKYSVLKSQMQKLSTFAVKIECKWFLEVNIILVQKLSKLQPSF